MRTRTLVASGAAGLAAVAALAGPAAASPMRPAGVVTANRVCYFQADGIRIHTRDAGAATTNSSPVVGAAYRGQSCWDIYYNSDSNWEHVTDRSTGVSGWVWEPYAPPGA